MEYQTYTGTNTHTVRYQPGILRLKANATIYFILPKLNFPFYFISSTHTTTTTTDIDLIKYFINKIKQDSSNETDFVYNTKIKV